jgi:hypothetical protein
MGFGASDRNDGHRCHPGGQRPQIVRVTRQQPSRHGQGVCCDRDDGVDGVVSAGPPEQLPSGPAEVRADGMLLDATEKGVHSGVATVTPEHLGQGYAADVDARADLLGKRDLGSYSRVALRPRAQRPSVKHYSGRDARRLQPSALPSHWLRTSCMISSGIGPCSAS